MRWLLWMWAFPITMLTAWYFLSLNDFGFVFFSRELHDEVFGIYGAVLGIAPESIPLLVAKAIAVDSLFVFGVIAFIRRRRIIEWWRARQTASIPNVRG